MDLMNEPVIYSSSGAAGVQVLRVGQYPSGEPLVVHEDVFASDVRKIVLRTTDMNIFMATMFWVDAMAERGRAVPEISIPFIPGARQDRLNETGDYLFTVKSIAKEINDRGFPRVFVLDPHSEVAPSLIDRCRTIHVDTVFGSTGDSFANRWSGVIAPDAGAEKRATKVAGVFGIPMFNAWKTRDISTGKLSGFGVQTIPDEVKDRPLLVVDDICDGGGTFVGLGEKLKEQGVRADLYVTHGLFTKGYDELLSFYENIITTDSITNQPEPPQYNVDEMMGNLITIKICVPS